jgi:hypothetical protein
MTQHTWTSIRASAQDGSIIYDAAVFWDGSLSDSVGAPLRPGDGHYPIVTQSNPVAVALERARSWARLFRGPVTIDVRHFE